MLYCVATFIWYSTFKELHAKIKTNLYYAISFFELSDFFTQIDIICWIWGISIYVLSNVTGKCRTHLINSFSTKYIPNGIEKINLRTVFLYCIYMLIWLRFQPEIWHKVLILFTYVSWLNCFFKHWEADKYISCNHATLEQIYSFWLDINLKHKSIAYIYNIKFIFRL